jgi:TonB-linked SusC/RagA family outer membrane protein
MKNFLLIIILAIVLKFQSFAQTYKLKGIIMDEDGKPVFAGNLYLLKSKSNAISDAVGQFEIFLNTDRDTLLITHIGLESVRIAVNRSMMLPINIRLKETATQLHEVKVNTGYQTLPKERATGSFEIINNSLINRSVSTDIISRLEGVSSIFFDRRTNGQALSIRGRSTILSNATPLIVIDNFPYDGDINNINPNDVESVSILKDAAAASIWGVRAANGVLVITTKKGKYNKEPQLELTTNVTYGQKPDLFYAPAMSSSDFIDVESFLYDKGYYNTIINNTARMPVISPVVEILNRKKTGVIRTQDGTNQIDALRQLDVRRDFGKYFYQSSLNQQYAMNYAGGTNKYNYLLSAGWDNNSSYLQRNELSRLTLRSENSFNPAKGLYVQAGIQFTQTNSTANNPGTSINPTSKNLYPYAALADAEGRSLAIVKDYRQGYLDTAGNGKLLDWKYRPLDELRLAENTVKQTDTRLNFGVQYKLMPSWNVEGRYQYEMQPASGQNLYDRNSYTARSLVNLYTQIPGGVTKYGVPPGGIIDISNSSLVSQAGRGQINYAHTWNEKHELSLIAGAEIRQTHTTSNNYRTFGYNNNILTYGNVNLVDLLPTFNSIAGTIQVPNPAGFSDGILRFTSYYANGAYTYLNRYTVSASVRKDASNLFGVNSNQKGVPLWSTGLSWQINNESFYKLNWLDLLKLRVTYGYNGNVDNTLAALTTIAYTSNSYMTGYQYASVRNPLNPELKWEKTGVLNIGLDFGIKSRVLTGSLEYYRKNGTDLIGVAPVDPTTGVVYPAGGFAYKGNVADMKGNGLDIELHSRNLDGRIQWLTDIFFNYTTNTVTRYNLPLTSSASAYVGYGNLVTPFEGKPVYAIYSYKWAGLDPINGDPLGYVNGEVSKDYSTITAASPNSLEYNGSAVPVTFGSLRNTFTYKDISLSFNLIFKLGYYFRRSSINYGNLFTIWSGHPDYANRWQKPGDEALTNVPSLIYPNSDTNRDSFYTNSSALVERGDNIRLQDINVSYSPKLSASVRKYMKQFQVYAYMRNLGIIWKANKVGLDPDNYSGGFPLPLTVSLGLKTTF